MKAVRLHKLIVGCLLVAMPFTLSGCRFVDKETQEAMQPVTLNYWRVVDNDDAFSQLVAEFQRLHPHISVNYRKLRLEEYEDELLDAWSEDRGPDILSLHNTWVPAYQTKLLPMPSRVTLPYQITQGTIKKETIVRLQTTAMPTPDDIRDTFVPAVAQDVMIKSRGADEVMRNEIYGLPLSVDTLALYYNRDLLNRFGIVQPPQTWKQFQDAVKAIAEIEPDDSITQAAVPFGAVETVDRYFDIVSLLMLQNGATMMNSRGEVVFDEFPAGYEGDLTPAAQALRFYTDFGRPLQDVYTWNDEQENSLLSFVAGDVPFFFGYSYHLPFIQANAPNLSLGVSQAPQITVTRPVNYANYWVETVSRKTEHPDESWSFVNFIADAKNVGSYLTATQKAPAITALIEDQLDDLFLGVFASQAPTAQSWYHGHDIQATEDLFGEMINGVLVQEGTEIDYEGPLQRAAEKVQQTYKN